jgi:aspartyl-tRNA(Asn)/glutamyl-tRNA(Gln) amidotransferase subunit C
MIDDKTMGNLQALSRLRLAPEEAHNLADQLEDILEYFKLLSGYDTERVNPDIGVAVEPAHLRTDEHRKGIDRETIETFAVSFDDGFFVVPRILGDEPDA